MGAVPATNPHFALVQTNQTSGKDAETKTNKQKVRHAEIHKAKRPSSKRQVPEVQVCAPAPKEAAPQLEFP